MAEGGGWNDAHCDGNQPAICEKKGKNLLFDRPDQDISDLKVLHIDDDFSLNFIITMTSSAMALHETKFLRMPNDWM